jgi:histidinol phosphatase-like enzyme
VQIMPERIAALAARHAEGWLLFAHAWRPQISAGETRAEDVQQVFERVRALLGVDTELAFCPHPAGPPICWCRKPLPGLALAFAVSRGVDLQRSVVVGRGAADRTLAQKVGAAYQDHDAFFAAH